ncbi:hypothetical protein ACPV4A_02230 [Vibrio rotiferianus]|uniref:hypothetical protein n=1 Tax=Vibrio rotiferianus TaxID=190895 RepID=UPI00406A441C
MALVITDAGLAASSRAGDLGVEFKISHISIGTEGYTPTKDQTELRAEIIRKPVVRGRIIKVGHLHFEADFVGQEEFEGKEIGYHLDDEDQTLFGVDSDDGKVMTLKRANSIVTEVFDLNLSASRIDNITVEVAATQKANEDTLGIAEVATIEEVMAGTDDERIVTPSKLKSYISAQGLPHLISDSSATIKMSAVNVFTCHKTIALPSGDDGDWFVATVHSGIDLKTGECAYTALDGELVNHDGARVPKVWFTKTNQEFRFIRINGEWCV